jgi:hypothetical protein
LEDKFDAFDANELLPKKPLMLEQFPIIEEKDDV